MASPGVLAGASIGTTLIGSLLGAFGANQAGQAQGNMYQYQAGVSLVNQQIAKQNAAYATSAGEVQTEQSGMQSKAQIGQTKAIQAAGNLDVNSGSNAAVRGSEEEVAAQDQSLIRSNAARTAYGYNVEAEQAGAQAKLYGMAADQSRTAGGITAISTLLGGATSISSKWLQAGQSGIPGFGGGNPINVGSATSIG